VGGNAVGDDSGRQRGWGSETADIFVGNDWKGRRGESVVRFSVNDSLEALMIFSRKEDVNRAQRVGVLAVIGEREEAVDHRIAHCEWDRDNVIVTGGVERAMGISVEIRRQMSGKSGVHKANIQAWG